MTEERRSYRERCFSGSRDIERGEDLERSPTASAMGHAPGVIAVTHLSWDNSPV